MLNRLENILNRIIEGYGPEKVYLFGSSIWGERREDSDIDLFIVKDSKDDRYKRQVEVRRFVRGEAPVDLLVYTPSEVERRVNMGDLFIKKIINEGKLLYAQ